MSRAFFVFSRLTAPGKVRSDRVKQSAPQTLLTNCLKFGKNSCLKTFPSTPRAVPLSDTAKQRPFSLADQLFMVGKYQNGTSSSTKNKFHQMSLVWLHKETKIYSIPLDKDIFYTVRQTSASARFGHCDFGLCDREPESCNCWNSSIAEKGAKRKLY